MDLAVHEFKHRNIGVWLLKNLAQRLEEGGVARGVVRQIKRWTFGYKSYVQ